MKRMPQSIVSCFAMVLLHASCATKQPKQVTQPVAGSAKAPRRHTRGGSPALHEEAALGVRLAMPKNWRRKDSSQAGVGVLLFGPKGGDLSTRISLLSFPLLYLPQGMATREAQVKGALGAKYERLRHEPHTLGGEKGEVLEYQANVGDAHRTVEYGVKRGDRLLIVQFVAPAAKWSAIKPLIGKAISTIQFFAPKQPAKPVNSKAAEKSPAPKFTTQVRIDSHKVAIRLDPTTGEFSATDRLRLTAKTNTSVAVLLIAKFDTLTVQDKHGELKYELAPFNNAQRITVKLRRELPKGAHLDLTVAVKATKYDFRTRNSPVSGYHILGQVDPQSAYSSHVLYYPIDADNRANTELRFHVPKGYQVVGPGKLLSKSAGNSGTTVYTWRSADKLIKQLPYGWAVGKYHQVTGRSRSGVPIRVSALPKHKNRSANIMKVAKDAIDFYERRFGPFPFPSVSIAEVKPLKGIAGVSLPGMILLSDGFFNGAKSYEGIKDIQAAFRGPLVIADELSHQYNFYSVALPNQLAEGLAQYTDSLFAESVAGAKISDHFAYYSRIYRGAISGAADQAIMSPAVYRTAAYMGIVFSKGACVLHMLRQQIGDKAFFAALRALFKQYRGKRAGVKEIRAIAEQVSGKKLKWFFDQWYARPGYPKLKLSWRQQGNKVKVEVTQKQSGKPFRVPLKLTVVQKQGQTKSPVQAELKSAKQTFVLSATGEVTDVVVSNRQALLASFE